MTDIDIDLKIDASRTERAAGPDDRQLASSTMELSEAVLRSLFFQPKTSTFLSYLDIESDATTLEELAPAVFRLGFWQVC